LGLFWVGIAFCISEKYSDRDLAQSSARPVIVSRQPAIAEAISLRASEVGVPAHLALALVWRESRFDPTAVHRERNGTRSWGLFQLNDRSFPKAPTMTPAENITAGLDHYARLWRRCGGQAECATAHYRGLPGTWVVAYDQAR
jgi:soluble lytic murein transglycosylase-like protein